LNYRYYHLQDKESFKIMKKKILLHLIILITILTTNVNGLENKILYKINNEIITSLDLTKEKKYIVILNPALKNLEQIKINQLAIDSILNEKIKEIEIKKYFKEVNYLENENVENILKNLIQQSGYNSEKDFVKYLNSIKLDLKFFKEKIAIEIYWNNLIFSKYNNQVVINKNSLEKEVMEETKKLKQLREINLSEILIRNEKNLDIKKTYNEIVKSIQDIGFKNTSSIYSKSDTAKYGGNIGWIKETSLSPVIVKQIYNLKEGQISKPIKISNNYIILKINKIKFYEKNLDINKLLENRITFEKNQQLGRFSIAYLNRVKKNININEL